MTVSNMRRNLLGTTLLVLLLAALLLPVTRLLSGGQDAGRQTADGVEPMLNLLAGSPAYRAQTAVEPMLELEEIWALEDEREESETPLVAGMLGANVPEKVVSAVLGHSGIQVTMDTYSHVNTAMQEKAVETMDKILNNLC